MNLFLTCLFSLVITQSPAELPAPSDDSVATPQLETPEPTPEKAAEPAGAPDGPEDTLLPGLGAGVAALAVGAGSMGAVLLVLGGAAALGVAASIGLFMADATVHTLGLLAFPSLTLAFGCVGAAVALTPLLSIPAAALAGALAATVGRVAFGKKLPLGKVTAISALISTATALPSGLVLAGGFFSMMTSTFVGVPLLLIWMLSDIGGTGRMDDRWAYTGLWMVAAGVAALVVVPPVVIGLTAVGHLLGAATSGLLVARAPAVE